MASSVKLLRLSSRLTSRVALGREHVCKNPGVRWFSSHPSLHAQSSASAAVRDNESLLLSDACVKQLNKISTSNNHLRILVEGGGCSGFQYKFELDSSINEDDRIFERDGAKVVVDADSLEFLKGSTIDYDEELIRSSFSIMKNPQADHGCSCGASFSLKL